MKRFVWIAVALLLLFGGSFAANEHFGWLTETRLVALTPSAPVAALLIVGLLGGDLLLPVPSSFVMIWSGQLFGLVGGAWVSFVGALLAAALGYGLGRWGNARWRRRLLGEDDPERARRWFARWGVYAIILSRPVPMLTEILSCLAGLARFSAPSFFLASALGTLPICVLYAWAGERGGEGQWWSLLVALVLPAIGFLVARRAGLLAEEGKPGAEGEAAAEATVPEP